MAESISGINEVKLDRLVLELEDHIVRVNNILNCIQDEINKTSQFVQCEAANQLRNKFQTTVGDFALVRSNLSTYIEDLTKVKYSYLLKNEDLTNYVRKQQQNIIQDQ